MTAAANYTIFKAKNISSIKFGNNSWDTAAFGRSGTAALDTSFGTRSTTLLNMVGALDAANPVTSAAFAKEIEITGNERNITEEDLLGQDTTGAQNKEVVGGPVGKLTCNIRGVFRNNIPLSIFNDNTKSCLVEIDNNESSVTGKLNIGMNNIQMVKVGDIKQGADGLMEQMVSFTFAGGTVGTAVTITQATPSETWSRSVGGNYAEEVRLT